MTDLDLAKPKVEPVAKQLDVSDEATERAEEIAENIDLRWAINLSPSVSAAAAVYVGCLLEADKRPRATVAEVSDVNEISIVSAKDKIFEQMGDGDSGQDWGIDEDVYDSPEHTESGGNAEELWAAYEKSRGMQLLSTDTESEGVVTGEPGEVSKDEQISVALKQLGVDSKGLDALTTATAEHRTVANERKSESSVKNRVKTFFN